MEKGPEEGDGTLIKEGTNPPYPPHNHLPVPADAVAMGGDSAVMTAAVSKLDPAEAVSSREEDAAADEEPVSRAPVAGKGKTIVKGPSRIADEGVRPSEALMNDSAETHEEKTQNYGEESAEEKATEELAGPVAQKGMKGTTGGPTADESDDGSGSEEDDSGDDDDDDRPSHPVAHKKVAENDIEVEIDDDEDSDEEDEDGDAGQATAASGADGPGASDQDDPSAQEGPTANENDADEDGDEDDEDEQLEIVEMEEADSDDEAEGDENEDEPRQPSAFGGRTTTSQNVGRVLVSQAGVESDDVEDEEDGEDEDADDEDEVEVDIEDEYNVAEFDPVDEQNASDADPKASDDDEEDEDGDDQAMYDGDDDESRPMPFDNTRDTADTMEDGDDRPVGYEDDEHDDLDDDDEDEEAGDVSLIPVEAVHDKYEDDDDDGVEQSDANVNDEKDVEIDEGEEMEGQEVENAGMSDHDQDNIAVYDGNGPFEDDGLEDDDDENDNMSGLDNVLAEDPNGVLPPAEFLSDDVPPEHQHLPPLNVVDEDPNVDGVPPLTGDLGDTAPETIAQESVPQGSIAQEEGESLKVLTLESLPPSLTGKRSGDALIAEDKEFVGEEDKDNRKGVAENEMNGVEDHERDRKKARIA